MSLQITKQQLQQTKDRFQAFLNGDTQIVADEAFINAVQSYTEVPATLVQFAKTGHALCAPSGLFFQTAFLFLLPFLLLPLAELRADVRVLKWWLKLSAV